MSNLSDLSNPVKESVVLVSSPMSLAEYLRRINMPDSPIADWYDRAFVCPDLDTIPPAQGRVVLSHESFGRIQQNESELEVAVETVMSTDVMALLAVLYRMNPLPVRRAALYRQALQYGFPPITQVLLGETMKDESEAERWKIRFAQLGVLGEIGVLHIVNLDGAANHAEGHDHQAVSYYINLPILDEIRIVKTVVDGHVKEFGRFFPIIFDESENK